MPDIQHYVSRFLFLPNLLLLTDNLLGFRDIQDHSATQITYRVLNIHIGYVIISQNHISSH